MKCLVFQSPYHKVLRRTKGVLPKVNMRIVSFDDVKGVIKARSAFALHKPAVEINVQIEAMGNHQTKVTVQGLQGKKLFFQADANAEAKVAALLDAISTVL